MFLQALVSVLYKSGLTQRHNKMLTLWMTLHICISMIESESESPYLRYEQHVYIAQTRRIAIKHTKPNGFSLSFDSFDVELVLPAALPVVMNRLMVVLLSNEAFIIWFNTFNGSTTIQTKHFGCLVMYTNTSLSMLSPWLFTTVKDVNSAERKPWNNYWNWDVRDLGRFSVHLQNVRTYRRTESIFREKQQSGTVDSTGICVIHWFIEEFRRILVNQIRILRTKRYRCYNIR